MVQPDGGAVLVPVLPQPEAVLASDKSCGLLRFAAALRGPEVAPFLLLVTLNILQLF